MTTRKKSATTKLLDEVKRERADLNKLPTKKPGAKPWTDYQDYLKSAQWKGIRETVLNRDGEACRLCGAEAQACHHWRYPKNWEDDSADNVIAVCSDCHDGIHTGKNATTAEQYVDEWQDGVDVGEHMNNVVSSERAVERYECMSEVRDWIEALKAGKSVNVTMPPVSEANRLYVLEILITLRTLARAHITFGDDF